MSRKKLKVVAADAVRSSKGDQSDDGNNAVLIAFNRTVTGLEAAGIARFIELGLDIHL